MNLSLTADGFKLIYMIYKRHPNPRQPITTEGFAYFWQYAARRQQIYWRQLKGSDVQLTDDPILAKYRFTNVYRASDRVSQYLINQVQGDWSWPDTFARTLVFKFFNRLDTWQYLHDQLGELTLQDVLTQRVDKVLSSIAGKRPLYNPAYIMPPPTWLTGPKFGRHLSLIRWMIEDNAHQRIKEAASLEDAFRVLRNYPSIGDFLAYQFIIDLNYSDHLNFSENEFVTPGPGARRGLRKCFAQTTGLTDSQLIHWTAERQDHEFAQRKLSWKNLWGRPLQLVDIQNIFCEVDKYTRLAKPELARFAPGKRPKQFYHPSNQMISAHFPKKWGLKS